MGENTYKIIYDCFRGVSRETCEAYLFRRCAEITRNHGFHYFVIDDIGNNIIRKDYINSDEATTTELVSGKCKNSTYAYVTGSEYTMIEPHYFATITLYKGERPADLPNSFTPDQIISNMK